MAPEAATEGRELQHHPTGLPSGSAPRRSDPTVEDDQRVVRLGAEVIPRGSEAHRATGPVEEPSPDLLLQLANGGADRRLGHVEPLGGPGEVSPLMIRR